MFWDGCQYRLHSNVNKYGMHASFKDGCLEETKSMDRAQDISSSNYFRKIYALPVCIVCIGITQLGDYINCVHVS